MKLIQALKRLVGNSDRSTQLLAEIREGHANLTGTIDRHLADINRNVAGQTELVNQRLREILSSLANDANLFDQRLKELSAAVANLTDVVNRRPGNGPDAVQAPLEMPPSHPIAGDPVSEPTPVEPSANRMPADLAIEPAPAESTPSPPAEPSAAIVLPVPQFSLTRPDPIADFIVTREFLAYAEYFAAAAERGAGPEVSAVLYALVRKLRPDHVLEFGAKEATAAEAIAHALHANDRGLLHVPAEPTETRARFDHWPPQLRDHIAIEDGADPADGEAAVRAPVISLAPELDRQTALSQMSAALGHLEPGGFLVLHRISQGEIAAALQDLVSATPGLVELGTRLHPPRGADALHFPASSLRSRDFTILRAA